MTRKSTEKIEGKLELSAFLLILRIGKFLKPFAGLFALVIVLNFIFSALSALSIAIIKPVFQLLFNQDVGVAPPVASSFFEGLKNSFYSRLQAMIFSPHDVFGTITNLSIFILSVFVLKNVFKYFGDIARVAMEEGLVKSIRDGVFKNLTSLSVDFFARKKEGTIISILLNDVSVVNNTTIIVFTETFRELTQVLLYLFLLITISPSLTAIAFSTSIISLVLLKVGMKYIRRYASRMQTTMADYTASMQETISGIRVVKAYNAEDNTIKRFLVQTARYVKAAIKHQRIISMIPAFNEVFAIAALCVVLLVGGQKVLVTHEMKADDLMLFLFSLFAIMSPIATTFNNVSRIQRGLVAAERVFGLLDSKPTVVSGLDEINNFTDKFEIDNISFAYDNEKVINDVSFSINKGQKVAFAGHSGSGKSTMLDLIIRFYDSDSGSIKIDGTDIRTLDIASYRSLFGIVAQDTMLFNDTIANNIAYGLENASKEQIEEAARLANAYDFIMRQPEGFQTNVGDRGISLSGGERQRIAIARALIRNPKIVVFDEATSALDAESESVVQETINSLLRDRTAIIVAHRLSTIRECDKIYVFDKGRIAESGSHSELIALGGVYKKLIDIQSYSEETD